MLLVDFARQQVTLTIHHTDEQEKRAGVGADNHARLSKEATDSSCKLCSS